MREVKREGNDYALDAWSKHAASATPEARWKLPDGVVCRDPDEYKVSQQRVQFMSHVIHVIHNIYSFIHSSTTLF